MADRQTEICGTAEPYWQINYDLRVIFVHNPRAGGTSILRALGMCHCQDGRRDDSGHPTQERLRQTHSRWWNDYFKLAWVRDPMTRAISAYQFSRGDRPVAGEEGGWANDHELLKNTSFEDCLRMLLQSNMLQQPMWKPQVHFIADVVGLDFIGRHESIERDWEEVCDRLGYDLFLPSLNASAPISQEYYTPFACAAIEHLYKADYEAFGYEFPSPHFEEESQPPEEHAQLPEFIPAKPCGGCGQIVPQPQLDLISVSGDLTTAFG